jgi:hypothetical protein
MTGSFCAAAESAPATQPAMRLAASAAIFKRADIGVSRLVCTI